MIGHFSHVTMLLQLIDVAVTKKPSGWPLVSITTFVVSPFCTVDAGRCRRKTVSPFLKWMKLPVTPSVGIYLANLSFTLIWILFPVITSFLSFMPLVDGVPLVYRWGHLI